MTSRFFKKQWRLLPGGLATLITVSLSQLGALRPLENASYRGFFHLRGQQRWDDRIALINIDDQTLAELGQFPLSRDRYAQLLQQLMEADVAVIGFNILFAEPSPADASLAEAIAQSGNVVLASAIDGRGNPLPPTEPLYSAASAIGHILRPLESDGLVHQVIPIQGQATAFGITLAERYGFTHAAIKTPSLDQALMINWPGPRAALANYSFVDVWSGTIPASAFKDKIVLIGMSATGVDALPTPFDVNPPGSGLLLHAAVLDNVLQQRFLQPIAFRAGWVFMLVAMPGVSYFLIGQSLWRQLAITVGGAAVWFSVCLLLFYGAYWLPVVPPLLLWSLTGISAMLSQQLRASIVLQRLLHDLWQHYRQDPHLKVPSLSPAQSIPDDLGCEVQKLVLLANSWGWAQATQAAIAQTVPIGLLAADEQTRVWFCNPLAMKWLSIQSGDLLTTALVPQWLADDTWQQILAPLWQGEAIAPVECQHYSQWFEFRFERLENLTQPHSLLTDGRQGILVLIEDITHRKAIETHLRLLNEGLEDEVRQRSQELEVTNFNLVREILERQQVQERLIHQALHDELTGLPNRTQFKTRLTELVTQAQQDRKCLFAVLFIDCDRFKLVNDSFGHLVGDQLLQAIAHRLRHCIARSDLVARFGGDEFTILLNHVQDAKTAVIVAQRIRQQLQKPFYIEEQQLYTGCSVGIVLSNSTYQQADEMLRDADTAMYQAKQGGLGVTLFEPAMHLAVRSSLQLETDLRRSLQRQELMVHYQPIFGLETQQIVGFEALVRWQHPHHGVVSPDQFIPLAEETGLIIPIGQWVMREACAQLRDWQVRHLIPAETFMSVNLSVQQFNEHHLLDRIDEILHSTQLDSQYLKLEITESAIMADSDMAIQTFQHLKDRGIRLGIDDFGTGYSSLNYLHCFPIDVLKVDRSFIQRMETGHKHLSLVRAIRTLAHHFDMVMVAEGIETSDPGGISARHEL
jgi:diguanylate cyclase (GGDEF)-like protein